LAYHDLALLELESKPKCNLEAIRLPTKKPETYGQGIAVGWGRTSAESAQREVASSPREIECTIVSPGYPGMNGGSFSVKCPDSFVKETGTQQGDSGGPSSKSRSAQWMLTHSFPSWERSPWAPRE